MWLLAIFRSEYGIADITDILEENKDVSQKPEASKVTLDEDTHADKAIEEMERENPELGKQRTDQSFVKPLGVQDRRKKPRDDMYGIESEHTLQTGNGNL